MRCKYSFTDEQLPISPWKQIKEQKTNDSDSIDKSFSDEEELEKILTEVTKNVKCPKCQSTAYLTGIGEKRTLKLT
jgi:cytochrome c-type biogenesis protein CcmH/NrfF